MPLLKLTDLRNSIHEINRSLMLERENGEALNETVLERIKATKGRDIEELAPKLVDIALVKLINDVSNRKGAKAITDEGLNLFSSYSGIPTSLTISRGRKKNTAKFSFAEVDLWLKAHDEKTDTGRHAPLKRLVEECRPFSKNADESLEVAMRRKQQAEQLKIQ